MDTDASQLADLDPALVRQILPGWLGSYVAVGGPDRARFVARVVESLSTTTDDEILAILAAFATAGDEYRLYPVVPAARRLSRSCMAELVAGSCVEGAHHLAEARGPTLLLCNHLSYVDTQITDLLLARTVAAPVWDQVVVVAGPKVYDAPFRRIGAGCLNTLKTAQSTALAYNEAGLSPREVGRIALETVAQVGELMASGHPVLVYAEGTRSRSGRLQPFLRAVGKYLALPGVSVIPLAIAGSERVFPIEAGCMQPAPVQLRLGAPVDGASAPPRQVLDEVWRRLAALLPEAYRPAPASEHPCD